MAIVNLDQEKLERLNELMDYRDKLNNEIRIMLDGKLIHKPNSELIHEATMKLDPERRKHTNKDRVDKIINEIKNHLKSKGIKETSSKELYPQFKSIFPDFHNFKKACVALTREGYKIWIS